MDHSVGLHDPPDAWFVRNISDHAPVFWAFSLKKPSGGMRPRLSVRICKHPLYNQYCNATLNGIDLSSMHIHERVELCKTVFLHMHNKVKLHCLEHEGTDPQNQLSILASVSRAIWNKNYPLARKLAQLYPVAASFLDLSGPIPVCSDPIGFESAFLLAKSNQISRNKHSLIREDAAAESAGRSRKNKGALAMLHRQAALWRPKSPYLALAGIKVAHSSVLGSGESDVLQVVSSPKEMCAALVQGWLPIFTAHGCNKSLARDFLFKYTKHVSWDWDRSAPPTLDSLKNRLAKCKNRAPGVDGIVDAAWAQGGEVAACVLYDFMWSLLEGSAPPPEFNVSGWLFDPKKPTISEICGAAATRAPKDTRPLALKNTDNKNVGGVVAHSLAPTCVHSTSVLQRGFVPSRQLLQNALEMDTFGRIAALRCMHLREAHALDGNVPAESVAKLAIQSMFDFSAAFPSVFHTWLFLVLSSVKAPQEVQNFVKALYVDAEAYWMNGGVLHYLFNVSCGVLQGCPMSSLLFNLAIDPLLWAFSCKIVQPGLGHVLACADDIGAVLQQLKDLRVMFKLFSMFRKVSGLKLHPDKCTLVLLGVRASPSVVSGVRGWLSVHIPAWASFNISNVGTYLGFCMGPDANTLQWVTPFAKYKSRVDHINSSKEPIYPAIALYNSKAASVLGYKAQLCLPPKGLVRSELGSTLKVMHMATNSLSHQAVFSLEHLMDLRITNLGCMFKASMARAANNTLVKVPQLFSAIQSCARECLPLSACNGTTFNVAGWDSPPMVCSLVDALGTNECLETVFRQREALQKKNKTPFKFQAFAYQQYRLSYECCTLQLWHRRLVEVCEDYNLLVSPAMCNLHANLEGLSRSSRALVLKTVANAWTTSSRYHEKAKLGCVFGCQLNCPVVVGNSCRDILRHYLKCPILWSIVGSHCSFSIPAAPSARLGISASNLDIRPLVISYCVYHRLKQQYYHLLVNMTNRRKWADILHIAHEAAAAFSSEVLGG